MIKALSLLQSPTARKERYDASQLNELLSDDIVFLMSANKSKA